MSGIEALHDEVLRWHSLMSTTPFSVMARWFIGLVFLISGILKLRDPARAALALVDFRVTRRARKSHGLGLGLIEFLLGGLVIVTPSAPVVGAAAFLLWIFVALIVRSLMRGEEFACFCFGDSDSTLSYWTAGRTTILALLATDFAIGFDAARLGLREETLSAVASVATMGSVFLLAQVSRLVRWNSNIRRMTA